MRHTSSAKITLPVESRRGSMAPAMMVALVVVISAVALTLDRIWLQAAQAELLTAAETAALGAGRHLASDDLLRPDSDPAGRVDRARTVAVDIASKSRIAGQSVQLDGSVEGDIRFGRLQKQERTGRVIFVETFHNPTSVVVRADHSRSRNNPVATFFHGLTGADGADVAAQAEATLDNHIRGFEPLNGAPIPILPLAILNSAPVGNKVESWQLSIDQRQGRDDFGYDEETGEVVRKPDGIPEIVLSPSDHDRSPEDVNAYVIVPQPRTAIDDLARQVITGWNYDDLPEGHTRLTADAGRHSFHTVTDIPGAVSDALPNILGQCRIVMLYDEFESTGGNRGRVSCVRFAAGRLMSLRYGRGKCEFVFQPGVMTTRSAILADESDTDASPERLANAYVFKLRLTQ